MFWTYIYFKRDSYIAQRMPGLRSQWKAETVAAVTHLALLGVKNGETALWGIKKQSKTDVSNVWYPLFYIQRETVKAEDECMFYSFTAFSAEM